MTVIMADDDSIDDDVFESKENSIPNSTLEVEEPNKNATAPSPTGYRGYKPPEEVLRMCETDHLEENEQMIHKVYLY